MEEALTEAENSPSPEDSLAMREEDDVKSSHISLDDAIISPWIVYLSENALWKLQKNVVNAKSVLKSLINLQKGRWLDCGLVSVQRSAADVPLYILPISEQMEAIWQVEVAYVQATRLYSQVIKVWDFLELNGLETCLKSINAAHTMYTANHAGLCKINGGCNQNKAFPQVYPNMEGCSLLKQTIAVTHSNDSACVEEALVTLKFTPLSPTVMRCILLGLKAEHPFQLSQAEYKVIEEPRSVVLLGRSGTGKTTCLVFRLYLLYKEYYARTSVITMRPESKLQKVKSVRQLFLTMSPVLCGKIDRYFKKLKACMEISFTHPSAIQDHLRNVRTSSLQEEKDDFIQDYKDEEDMFSNLSSDFRSLKDEDFPLFITYRKLLQMLSGTVVDLENLGIHHEPKCVPQWLTGSEVTFELFESFYWPKIDERKKRQQNPALVWAEMYSLIKGSELTLTNKEPYISAAQYLSASCRSFPNFTHERELLYDIFMQYEQIKRQYGHHDLMDYVHHLYHEMLNQNISVTVDAVYIDEVQDLTVSQLKLLQLICKNTKGLFLCGDTAQSISRGSAFRFEEVTAMLFRSYNEDWKELKPQKFVQSSKPAIMQLTRNYRSHGGILRLAASVVDLIECYFQGSIDSLERDTGLLEGPRPVFLEANPLNTMGFQEIDASHNAIDFGAEQVILVRDQIEKQNVQKIFRTGLILTIYEAKGMEFNDVLLFEFFKSSPAKLNWRVLLHSVKGVKQKYPEFDPLKHTILCSELKQLYTAITRARKQLWIFEANKEYSYPLLSYWKNLNLIEVIEVLGTNMTEVNEKLKQIAKKSSPEMWLKKGTMYFENRLFEQALYCFENGGDYDRKSFCEAYLKKQTAKKCMDTGDTCGGSRLYHQAADLFLRLGQVRAASRCFLHGGYFIQAGKLLESTGDFKSAADAYVRGNDFHSAAKCMEAAHMHTKALELYKQGGLLHVAIDRLQNASYREKVDRHILNRTVEMFSLPLLDKAQHAHDSKLDSQIVTALSLLETKYRERLLVDNGYVDYMLELDNETDHIKLAELYEKNGQIQKSAECFLKGAQAFATAASQKFTSEYTLTSMNCMIERCANCMIQFVRDQVTKTYPGLLPFHLNTSGGLNEREDELQYTFNEALSLLFRAKDLLTGFRNFLEDTEMDHGAKIDHANVKILEPYLLAVQVLQAQTRGDISALQQSLASFKKIFSCKGLSGEGNLLLILCTALQDGKFVVEWETWIAYHNRLMEIYKYANGIITNGSQLPLNAKTYLEPLEELFLLKSYTKQEIYMLREDPINLEIVSRLSLWQTDVCTKGRTSPSIITDDTPPRSMHKVWQCSKNETKEVIKNVFGRNIYKIIAAAVAKGKLEKALQEPCQAFNVLGVCQRYKCPFSHISTSLESFTIFLSRLMQQSGLAAFQVELARRLFPQFERDEQIKALKLLRFWLEKLQNNLQTVSPLVSSSEAISKTFVHQNMPVSALDELVANVWIRTEYNYSDSEYVFQALYMILQLRCKSIPSCILMLSHEVENIKEPLPPGLVFDPHDSHPKRIVLPIHFLVVCMLECTIRSQPRRLVQYGIRYIRYIVSRRYQMSFRKPWNILWLLELIAGVIMAVKKRFKNVVLPSSVVYTFLQHYPQLCDKIFHENMDCITMLLQVCKLAFDLWMNRMFFWLHKDQRWGAEIRILTILTLASYHLPTEVQDNCLHDLISLYLSLSEAHPLRSPKDIKSVADCYHTLSTFLEGTLDPLVVVKVVGSSGPMPWFLHGLSTIFEIDSRGNLTKTTSSSTEKYTHYETPVEDDINGGYFAKTEQSLVEEEDLTLRMDLKEDMRRREQAAKVIQSCFRKKNQIRYQQPERDLQWDKLFQEAISSAKTWFPWITSRHANAKAAQWYKMYFLGAIVPKIYTLHKAHQSLESDLRQTRRRAAREASQQSDLELHLDRIETLRDVIDDVETCLQRIGIDRESHTSTERSVLLDMEAMADDALKKFHKVSSSSRRGGYKISQQYE